MIKMNQDRITDKERFDRKYYTSLDAYVSTLAEKPERSWDVSTMSGHELDGKTFKFINFYPYPVKLSDGREIEFQIGTFAFMPTDEEKNRITSALSTLGGGEVSLDETLEAYRILGNFPIRTYYVIRQNGDYIQTEENLLRIQSICVWGHILSATNCDCQWQFEESKRIIADNGGMIIYALNENGKGVGAIDHSLINSEGLHRGNKDIFWESYIALGFKPDYRNFGPNSDVLTILKHLGVHGRVGLLEATNNPVKVEMLRDAGYNVTRVPLQMPPEEIRNKRDDYQLELSIKQRLGHKIEI